MSDIEFGKVVGPGKVMCRFKWDAPIVNLASGHIRMCCRVPKQLVTEEDLLKYGKDAIMNRPYEKERRLEMLKGLSHRDCESCLSLEAAGAPNLRAGIPMFVKHYWLPHRDPGAAPPLDTRSYLKANCQRK